MSRSPLGGRLRAERGEASDGGEEHFLRGRGWWWGDRSPWTHETHTRLHERPPRCARAAQAAEPHAVRAARHDACACSSEARLVQRLADAPAVVLLQAPQQEQVCGGAGRTRRGGRKGAGRRN